MFTENPEGQTHSFEDGCLPAHCACGDSSKKYDHHSEYCCCAKRHFKASDIEKDWEKELTQPIECLWCGKKLEPIIEKGVKSKYSFYCKEHNDRIISIG